MKGNSDDSIKVFVRVRPFNNKELNTNACLDINSINSIKMKDKQNDHQFAFDHIFNTESTQQQVYDRVGKQVVNSAFEGFNGTIFAYGQTASGKTHTCIGPDYFDKQKRGILPRLIDQIFQTIISLPSCIQFRIKISMVQIYLEKIKDLFDSSKNDLKIRQNRSKGLYLQDVTQQYVASAQQTIQLIKKGINNRSVGQTNMNDVSSRSHMAFIITLYQNNLKDLSAKSGKIILVDLAGSQKVNKTGAQGKSLDEAKNINKSLSALGNVINALTQTKVAYIPYRDSKLTRLLQQSIGGNSKTHLIINVSPSNFNQPETLSSLRFGFRAKQIKNKPKVNKQYTVAELLLLLEKAQRKNQQLQQIIKDLTYSKRKSKKQPQFMQNLLDSQNPILSNFESQQQKPQFLKNSSRLSKAMILKYDTENQSDSDQQQKQPKKQQSSNEKNSGNKQIDNQYQEKQLLLEQIQAINFEKTNIYRQYEIYKQKYDILMKQARINVNKVNTQQKQNQKLIEKFITEQMHSQQKDIKLRQLQQKIENYQSTLDQLLLMKNKSNKHSVFSGEVQQIIQKAKQYGNIQSQGQYINKQLQNNQLDKQKVISQLQTKIKDLQCQISVYKHLQLQKQNLVKEKLSFVSEREKLYQDLQNRIEKVLDLEEKLDEEIDKKKFYQNLIQSQQSQKARKLVLMQQHLAEMSENYYVLKGQQSSWKNDNQKIQKKIQMKNKQIDQLEKQMLNMKQEIEMLKLKNQQLQQQVQNQSVLDYDIQYLPKKQPNIVKVVRSSTIRIV